MAEENDKQHVDGQEAEPQPSSDEAGPEADKTAKKDSPSQEGEKKGGLLGRLKKGKRQDQGEPTQKSPEEVAEELYKRIAEARGVDYFVFRIRKRTILLVLGLVIILMWVFLSWQWWQETLITTTDKETIQNTEAALSEAPTQESDLAIRIRNASVGSDGAAQLASRLNELGYVRTQVVDDPEADYEAISVVVRPEATKVRLELESALEDQYLLSSPSAELTADSDFDVVILYHDSGMLP